MTFLVAKRYALALLCLLLAAGACSEEPGVGGLPTSSGTGTGSLTSGGSITNGTTGVAPGTSTTGGTPGCEVGQGLCGTSCVSLLTNSSNCGGCGNVCPAGTACDAGVCGCLAGLASCGGSCVDTSSNIANCGACGTVCAAQQVCSLGACGDSCSVGLTECSGGCVDISTDLMNCGACGTPCPGGQACSNGQCGCALSGQTYCEGAGACVNTQTDPAHCGSCGTQCSAGQTCSSGSCSGGTTTGAGGMGGSQGTDGAQGAGGSQGTGGDGTVTATATTGPTCSANDTLCGEQCVNTSSNTSHCGGCNQGCGSGEQCVNGSCQGPPTGDCEDAVGSYQATVSIEGSSNAQSLIQNAVNSLSSGRSSKQAVLVTGAGSMSAGSRVSLPSYTILNVCGTINVTGSGSGDMAPVYSRGTTDIEVPNLTVTGSPNYAMFFRNVNNIDLGNIELRLSGGLGIRVDNHGGDRAVKSRNLNIDYVYVEGSGTHGVETYGVDGITIGTVIARDTTDSGLLLNDSINAEVGLVDADGAGTGTGYAAFRMANRNGRVGSSYPDNIHVGEVIARGGGRGIFCVSESGGVTIDRIDLANTGNNSILIENCYNVNIAAEGGTVSGGGEIRLAARSDFPNNSDITIQNLTVSGTNITENPCADGSSFLNNTLSGGASLNVCD